VKAIRDLTRAEIERASDKAHKARFTFCDEMIVAGRGYERPSETALKNDDLSLRHTAALQLAHDIAAECRRRLDFHGNLHRTSA